MTILKQLITIISELPQSLINAMNKLAFDLQNFNNRLNPQNKQNYIKREINKEKDILE